MCSFSMRSLLMQSKDELIMIGQVPSNFLCSNSIGILWFLDYENDFPLSTSALLLIRVSTFFYFGYAEIYKLKLEVHIAC